MPRPTLRARPLLLATLAALTLTPALAWTQKPVRLVVPAPAGGTMDTLARVLGDQIATAIGQPVIVDNRPGAGGSIAWQAVKSAPADGQTLMVTASNVLTEIPHVMKTAFEPLRDAKPIAMAARAGMVLVGAPKLPAKDLKGLLAYLKAHPGQHSHASYSAGTSSHYAGAILNQQAGLDLQHVPFAGSPPALAQVMGGQISVMFDGIPTAKPLIATGKLVAYGVASKQRSPQLPQVPTLAEQGFPELNFSNWVGVVGASGLSAELADKIHAVVASAVASPKFRERITAAGFDPAEDLSPAQLGLLMQADYERNAAIVRTHRISANP